MLSKILKKLRKNTDKTQKEIAANLNISRVNYNRYETGEREPDYQTLILLSNYFDVSIDYLLGQTDIKEKLYKTILHDLTSIEYNLIKKYRIIDSRGKMRVDDTLNREYEFSQNDNASNVN